MFKVDIKHAFRLIPVHRDDWSILGMVYGLAKILWTRYCCSVCVHHLLSLTILPKPSARYYVTTTR